MTKHFGRVAVLMGGRSAEREISLKSGQAVLAALLRSGIDAYAFDPAQRPLSDLVGTNMAFIALHGRYGEDGCIQGALELMQIAYTGSGVMASALGMDKWRTKLLWQAAGVVTPDFRLLDDSSDLAAVAHQLGLPLFIKPANEGSSIGISKVKQLDTMQAAYQLARQSDRLVLAEQFIGGGEYTVGILGEQALPIIRIVAANEFYDYEAKYSRNDTQYLCPCGLDAATQQAIQQQALQAFRVLGGRGWGRVDFLMDEQGQHYFLEVNTSPGMTDHSLVPMAAKALGISFDQLVIRILQQALEDGGASVE